MRCSGLEELTADLTALDGRGRWVVVLPFDGPPVCARFGVWEPVVRAPGPADVALLDWRSNLDRATYAKGVDAIREAIAAGDVYQVNLCRRLSAALPRGFDILAFGARLAAAHPAPHAAVVQLPAAGVFVASASPERFLSRRGQMVESRPIKGTAAGAAAFLAKDRAENVMIVDLVRNDLGRVCEYGSVEVPALCEVEAHPGLFHLVSTVRGRLRADTGWAEIVAATFPPGSVTGAPKLAALHLIRQLEPVHRSVYCGAIGWVDADRAEADLSVAIRTFWVEDGQLHLGVGGGITWGSTAEGEWEETQLKARRLLAVAAG
ncbi:MAG: anthranilate synthase component I family protein [Actinomycetota bacterium]|nr:anthranilate synthase component I family protein [Actinomycetota bacterium]